MIKKIIEKITNLLFAKQLLKQKQLTESFPPYKLRGGKNYPALSKIPFQLDLTQYLMCDRIFIVLNN